MTTEQFFKQIEDYYGEYQNQRVKQVVCGYLEREHKTGKFKDILKAVLYFHEARFGAPCIATIESCLKSARFEKGQTDTHKTKAIKPEVYDYSKDPECEKGTKKVDLTGMLNKTIKKVER